MNTFTVVVIAVISLSIASFAQVCNTNADCVITGQFCNKTACALPGQCTLMNDISTCVSLGPGVPPVCGCDGIQWYSPCIANSQGVSTEPCPPPPSPSPCLTNADCPTTYFCNMSGRCSGPGMCYPKPSLSNCPMTNYYGPPMVCGCDGNKYYSVCFANQAGTNWHPCPTPVPITGCKSNADCTSTQYCMKPRGGCSGQGTCVTKPQVCPLVITTGMCGCDGQNYSSACFAARVGVNINFNTPCPSTSPCNSNANCQPGYWCQHPVGNCGSAGQCVATTGYSTFCSPGYVCGCDGVTYSTYCAATSAQVSIRSNTVCYRL